MIFVVVSPLLVALGDAALTGVGRQALFAYAAVGITALFVGGVIACWPGAFDLREFHLGGVFVFTFQVTMLLGTPSVYGEHAHESSAVTFLVTVCIGYALTTLACAAGAPSREVSFGSPGPSMPTRIADHFGLLLAGTCVMVFLAYMAATPVLPLVEALRGARVSDLTVARQDALTGLSSPLLAYLFGAMRDVIIPAAAAILLFQWVRYRGARRFVLFAGVFLIAAFSAAVTTEKSPLGRLLLVLALTLWIARRRSLRWSTLLVASLLFVTFPFMVSKLSNSPLNSNADIAAVLGDRMFRLPAQVHYHYVAYIDNDLGQYLSGRTIPNLGKLAPGPSVALTSEVSDRLFPDAAVQGNANGSYLSNFYADFGMLGIVFGSVVTGLLIAWLDSSTRSMPRVVGVPLHAVTSVQLLFITSSSLFDSIAQFPFGNLGLMAVAALLVHVWVPLRRPVRHGAPNAAANAST